MLSGLAFSKAVLAASTCAAEDADADDANNAAVDDKDGGWADPGASDGCDDCDDCDDDSDWAEKGRDDEDENDDDDEDDEDDEDDRKVGAGLVDDRCEKAPAATLLEGFHLVCHVRI